jgi:DNA-binding NarL/FixJ family response regulator
MDSPQKIRVLIVDDHKIIRVGLKGFIHLQNDMEVIGECGSEEEALALVESLSPDVILMDIDLEGSSGISATRQIKTLHPDQKILAITLHEEETSILPMIQAGALGYVLKNADPSEMIDAIRAINKGNSYYSRHVSDVIMHSLTRPKTSALPDGLTAREVEVLSMIAQEYSNGQIAEKLFISIRTVDTHRRNLLDKLGLKNTAGLVKYAIEKGLI